MILPDSTPKLPKWFFLLSDALLIAAAAFIASHSAAPLSNTVIFTIVGCVATGAIVTGFAFIADYTRKQDEAIDDRQRALESLARTVATSAEQISIATNGLHEITELAQKNLRQAEQLPHKLQDKMAEFQAQLANANDTEKEELEKELVALRTTESERLESISDKIAKSSSEWARLEAATQKHLVDLDGKLTPALAALDARLAACTALVERALAAAQTLSTAAPPPSSALASVPGADVSASLPPAALSTPADPAPKISVSTEGTAHPPKRPRKPRREEPASEEPAGETPAPAPAAPSTDPIAEPPPVPIEKIPEITPIAPATAEPFSGNIADTPSPATPPPAPPPAETPAPAAIEPPKPPRKRPAKKPNEESPAAAPAVPSQPAEPEFNLDLKETPAEQSAEIAERVRTSDGATRLLVTAYIGIGNRLFVRGEGPGLSWDKGVPLQFVSIGKWRWETHEATAPVKFKLYKNDEAECTALGAQTLDPGHQQEVTAAF